MTIITWNCNMAFRNKAAHILRYQPDVLVIQECEHPAKINFEQHIQQPSSVLWVGSNENKGLGIYAYNGLRLTLHRSYDPGLQWIAPVKVTGPSCNFLLFAVWANNPGDKDGPYITQIWKAMERYKKLIRKKNTVLAGDFNSNTIWDKPRRKGNHSTVVKLLGEKGIASTYHHYFEQQQGQEAHPTLYLHRNIQKPYHLDYCFASADFMQNLLTVEMGEATYWLRHSDHIPVISRFTSAPLK